MESGAEGGREAEPGCKPEQGWRVGQKHKGGGNLEAQLGREK